MKKILYSLLAIGGLFATSCATFDDPVTESYADGPKVTIDVIETTDSTFTFTVSAEGAAYYSVLIDQAAEAEEINATSLYKGAYSSVYSQAAIDATEAYTFNMRDASGEPLGKPNTSYVIYAVAGSKQGVIGEVSTQVVVTTDALAPRPTDYDYDGEAKAMYVSFSESNIYRGEGAVTAKYYQYVDLKSAKVNPIDVPAEELQIVTSGNMIRIMAPTTPAGAYVAFSYEAGAFVDANGNACAALTSGFNSATGKFVGLVGQNNEVAFDITAENVVSPELGTSFGSWMEFMCEIAFDFDVYQATKATGAIKVTYTNAITTKTIALTSEMWGTDGNQLVFFLPEAPAIGDIVTFEVAEGAICDVCGNPNNKSVFLVGWLFYGFTRDQFLGDYAMSYTSYFDGKTYNEAINVAADPESESGVLINNLLMEGTQIKGVFDGDYGTITIPTGQYLGTYTLRIDAAGNTAELDFWFMDGTDLDEVVWQLAADGSFTTSYLWGYYMTYAADGASFGWYDAAAKTTGTKVETATVTTSKLNLQRTVKALSGLKVSKK